MFRRHHQHFAWAQGFPRIRGDVPASWSRQQRIWMFSPHTRGCSSAANINAKVAAVFPAYAGMFRSWVSPAPTNYRFPRIRGDVPLWIPQVGEFLSFSPHTRGCSFHVGLITLSHTVFPAYAGMFRRLPALLPMLVSFPRIRGDVPNQSRRHQRH